MNKYLTIMEMFIINCFTTSPTVYTEINSRYVEQMWYLKSIKSQTEHFILPVDEYLCLFEASRNGKKKMIDINIYIHI